MLVKAWATAKGMSATGHDSFTTDSSFKGCSIVVAKTAGASGCIQVLGSRGRPNSKETNKSSVKKPSKLTKALSVWTTNPHFVMFRLGYGAALQQNRSQMAVIRPACLSLLHSIEASYSCVYVMQQIQTCRADNSSVWPVLLQCCPMAKQQSIRKPRSVWHSIMHPSQAAQHTTWLLMKLTPKCVTFLLF